MAGKRQYRQLLLQLLPMLLMLQLPHFLDAFVMRGPGISVSAGVSPSASPLRKWHAPSFAASDSNNLLGPQWTSSPPTAVSPDALKRVEKLINKHKLFVFLKGTPDEPQCGFSRVLVQALQASPSGSQLDRGAHTPEASNPRFPMNFKNVSCNIGRTVKTWFIIWDSSFSRSFLLLRHAESTKFRIWTFYRIPRREKQSRCSGNGKPFPSCMYSRNWLGVQILWWRCSETKPSIISYNNTASYRLSLGFLRLRIGVLSCAYPWI